MKIHEKYKNSDVNWLGKVPEHWQIKRVKDLCRLQSGFYISANDFVEEGYPIFGGNGFRGYAKEFNHEGEYILIGRQGALCGNINYAKNKFWATEHAIVVYEKNNVNLTWFGELLRVMNLNQYSLSAAQPGLSVEKIKQLQLPYVSGICEQEEIANYLLAKSDIIDSKISLLEQKAEKYNELRKSLINQIITKGLDLNVVLVPSFIGESPTNWDSVRMKDIGFLYSGLSGKSGKDFDEEDIENSKHYLPFTNIASNTYVDTKAFGLVFIGEKENQNKIKKNDLFFMMSSEGYDDVGKAALLDEEVPSETYLNSFCKGFRITSKNVVPKFLNWLLYSSVYRENLLVQGKGFTRINLKMDKINDFEIIIPKTLEEQTQIADYLDVKTQQIDAIVENIEKQMNSLSELRKTLINDVVIGKIKVTA